MYTCKLVWEDKSDMNINFLFKNNKLQYDTALYYYFTGLSFMDFSILQTNFSEVAKSIIFLHILIL